MSREPVLWLFLLPFMGITPSWLPLASSVFLIQRCQVPAAKLAHHFLVVQCCVQHQAQKLRILLRVLHDQCQQTVEHFEVVARVGGVAQFVHPALGAGFTRLHLQNGFVQCRFAREVSKDDGFGDAGRIRNLPGRRRAEPAGREQLTGNGDQSLASIGAAQSLRRLASGPQWGGRPPSGR